MEYITTYRADMHFFAQSMTDTPPPTPPDKKGLRRTPIPRNKEYVISLHITFYLGCDRPHTTEDGGTDYHTT